MAFVGLDRSRVETSSTDARSLDVNHRLSAKDLYTLTACALSALENFRWPEVHGKFENNGRKSAEHALCVGRRHVDTMTLI